MRPDHSEQYSANDRMRKRALFLGTLIFSTLAYSQSSVVFDAGTTIEVGAGADICADLITIDGSSSGDGTKCGGPLPVELVSLTATPGSREVTLNWHTATEVDNYGFEIERRLVGNQNWAPVGFVQGAGTSNTPREYSFTDSNLPSGRYAYRIKQIDHSGSFTYTSALEVVIGVAPLEFTLSQNYPNPFNPTTTIEFTLPKDGHVLLKVFDMVGREVATLVDGERKAGVIQQVLFDASSLGSGMYVYRLQSDGIVLGKKLMVVK